MNFQRLFAFLLILVGVGAASTALAIKNPTPGEPLFPRQTPYYSDCCATPLPPTTAPLTVAPATLAPSTVMRGVDFGYADSAEQRLAQTFVADADQTVNTLYLWPGYGSSDNSGAGGIFISIREYSTAIPINSGTLLAVTTFQPALAAEPTEKALPLSNSVNFQAGHGYVFTIESKQKDTSCEFLTSGDDPVPTRKLFSGNKVTWTDLSATGAPSESLIYRFE